MTMLLLLLGPGVSPDPRVLLLRACRKGHIEEPRGRSCRQCMNISERARYQRNIEKMRTYYRERYRRRTGYVPREPGTCPQGHRTDAPDATYKDGTCRECARARAKAYWRKKHPVPRLPEPVVPTGRCTTCNWSTHDASHHHVFCRYGHPLDLPSSRYENGRCRMCQRARTRQQAIQKKYTGPRQQAVDPRSGRHARKRYPDGRLELSSPPTGQPIAKRSRLATGVPVGSSGSPGQLNRPVGGDDSPRSR